MEGVEVEMDVRGTCFVGRELWLAKMNFPIF